MWRLRSHVRDDLLDSPRVILSEAKEPYPDAWLLRSAQDDSRQDFELFLSVRLTAATLHVSTPALSAYPITAPSNVTRYHPRASESTESVSPASSTASSGAPRPRARLTWIVRRATLSSVGAASGAADAGAVSRAEDRGATTAAAAVSAASDAGFVDPTSIGAAALTAAPNEDRCSPG